MSYNYYRLGDFAGPPEVKLGSQALACCAFPL